MRALVYHGPGRKAFQEVPVAAAGQIDARRFITHRFGLDDFGEAYDVFTRAADTGALKVVLSRPGE